MKIHLSRPWRVLLLALPMLMGSLVGYGYTDHTFYFGGVSQDAQALNNGQGTPIFTYSTEGNIANLSYNSGNEVGTASNGNGGLQFYISGSDNSSLTMTTVYAPSSPSIINQQSPSFDYQDSNQFNGKVLIPESNQFNGIIQNSELSQGFSGTLKGIEVSCPEIYGLVIEAYDGTTLLGQLEYSQKIGYFISGMSYLLQSKQISLKFSAPNAPNGASVYELTSVTISVDESVYPMNMDEPVTFNGIDLLYADLSNYTYKGILFTLHTATDGEGVDNTGEEGVVCFMTPLTDTKVSQLNDAVNSYNYKPGESGYAIDFSGGITLMVAKGSGVIVLDAETNANYAFHIKIGDNAPVEVASTTRKALEVPYNVDKDTYVYVYLVSKGASVRGGIDPKRPPRTIGRRGTSYGRIYEVRYATSVAIIGDVNGSGNVDKNDVYAIADYIMGLNPDGFNMTQADFNKDGVVNVADLVKLVQIVMGQTP